MIFRTFSNERERHYAPIGAHTEMRHRAVMKEDGRRVLVRDKEVAIYDLIQSHKEECEIENIIRRAVEGDYNALNAVKGIYTDITNMPSSIAEAQQYIIAAKEEFDKLPKEIKAKFEYNPEIYVAEMGGNTEVWLDKMGYTEKIKLQKELAEREATTEANFQKAMENLASGGIIKNTEVEANE